MRVVSVLLRALATALRDPLGCLVLPLLAAGSVLVLAYFGYQDVLVRYGYDDTPLMFAISQIDTQHLLVLLAVGVALAGPLAHRTYHRCVGRSPAILESIRAGLRATPVVIGYGFVMGTLALVCLSVAVSLAHPVHRLGLIDTPVGAWLLLGVVPVVAVGARLSLVIPLATMPRPDRGGAFHRSWIRTRNHRTGITVLGVGWFYGGAAALFLPLRWLPRYWVSPDIWCAARALWFAVCFLLGVAGVILASVNLAEIGTAEERLDPTAVDPEDPRAIV